MSDREQGVPAGLDPSRPSIARVWDFLLGGKDNYRADREQAARLIEIVPALVPLARESRAFTASAVTWLAGAQGISQFIDLGCGLPTTPPAGAPGGPGGTAGGAGGLRGQRPDGGDACAGAAGR
jgi:hypothetical protein